MTREHSPRPGVTWEQQHTTREVVVPDGPQGVDTPAQAASNREQRRALRRANRRKGNR